jgi:four helix bundle protein
MELARVVYETTRTFPPDERFGLTNQLRRASVSIPSNIAEGNGRLTTDELIQFLGIARGSALELQTQMEIALMLGFGNRLDCERAYDLVAEEIRILNAALKTLRAKHAKKRP